VGNEKLLSRERGGREKVFVGTDSDDFTSRGGREEEEEGREGEGEGEGAEARRGWDNAISLRTAMAGRRSYTNDCERSEKKKRMSENEQQTRR
jgi:hypothetical protein